MFNKFLKEIAKKVGKDFSSFLFRKPFKDTLDNSYNSGEIKFNHQDTTELSDDGFEKDITTNSWVNRLNNSRQNIKKPDNINNFNKYNINKNGSNTRQ